MVNLTTVNLYFHLIQSKSLPMNDFKLTVPDLYKMSIHFAVSSGIVLICIYVDDWTAERVIIASIVNSVCIDDWTVERAIIASIVNSVCIDDWTVK